MSEPVHVFIRDAVVDITALPPGYVDVLHIARTLSRLNRFCGNTRWPYSVAQHAVLTSYLVAPKYAYEALHHDDTEAFMGDVISPIKNAGVRKIEEQVRACISATFGTPAVESTAVKAGDRHALLIEQEILQGRATMPTFPVGKIQSIQHALSYVRQLHPLRAEEAYLARHKELGGV